MNLSSFTYAISILLSLVTGMPAILAQPAVKTNQEAPNIIFLMSDDHRADALGFKGNPDVISPNLDSLARKGIVFNRHYASSPICMNSRASVMTGLPEYMTGTGFHHGSMTRAIWDDSYPALLKENGYITGFAGKFGYGIYPNEEESQTLAWKGFDNKPLDDFDMYTGFSGGGNYSTHKNDSLAYLADQYPHVSKALGAVGKDFIAKWAKGDKPFCLSISFKTPHKPFEPDTAYDQLFEDRTYAHPPNWGPGGASHLPLQAIAGRQYAQMRDHWYPDSVFQKDIRKYYQLIYGMDVAIGMIINELEKQGIADNTIIVYTSDNGYFTGSHNMQGKTLAYEEASLLPMIVYDPRSPAMGKDHRVERLSSNLDVAPTILEWAGVAIPPVMIGKSLVPVIEEPGHKLHNSLSLINVFQDSEQCQALAVVTEEFKYTYWYYHSEVPVPTPFDSVNLHIYEPAEELYKLSVDSLEMHNLAADSNYAELLDSMRSIYDDHLHHWQANRVDRNGYPAYDSLFVRKPDTCLCPVDTTGTPVDTTGTPVDTTGIPVDTTGTPIDTTGNPVDTMVTYLSLRQFEDLSVFPNPGSEGAYIQFRLTGDKEIHTEILGTRGRMVWKLPGIRCMAGINRIRVSYRGLEDGVYIMRIKSRDGKYRDSWRIFIRKD